ncbi:MAG TPA: hypothetical protein DEB10_11855 [Ruminococcaceae bacterium]|jgi:membrane protein implicated in regulation of membrane protease activity|nr:hypothetical protein [Oscillospiraceae bacterium]
MIDWWNSQPLMQQIFYLVAIPSTIILLLQTILLLFGLGDDHDGGTDTDFSGQGEADADHEFSHDQGAAHESGLRVFTIRGIIAFLAMFGWTGVAVLDMGAGAPAAFALALLAGIVALVVVALVIRASLKLQQSGNLDLQNAVGVIGEVYLTIPQGGRGKVTLIVQERYMEMDAVCPDRAVKAGEQVKVTAVTPSNTLIVSPLYQTVS